VNVATKGDFSPGAIAGPLGKCTSIDETGVFAKYTRSPSFTFTAVHPLMASSEPNAKQTAQRVLCAAKDFRSLHLLILETSLVKASY
jgi:hypothetical protein